MQCVMAGESIAFRYTSSLPRLFHMARCRLSPVPCPIAFTLLTWKLRTLRRDSLKQVLLDPSAFADHTEAGHFSQGLD